MVSNLYVETFLKVIFVYFSQAWLIRVSWINVNGKIIVNVFGGPKLGVTLLSSFLNYEDS